MDGKGILASDNLNVKEHPTWSQISAIDVGNNGTTNFLSQLWIDPAIWNMDQPKFTCSPPCTAKIPPWTGATSTVNYPLMTVSQGTWTSTITRPPVTVTEWLFEPVTVLSAAARNNRRAASTTSMWPVPATTPFWPAFVYTGNDGKLTTTSASGQFPSGPKSIGPGAPLPPKGSWPKRQVEIWFGPNELPLVDPCSFTSFYNPACIIQPWFGGNSTQGGGGDPGDQDYENYPDNQVVCPIETESSSTSSRPAASPTAMPTFSYNEGDPRTNKVNCYGSGENTENERMQNAAKSFCRDIAGDLLGPGYFQQKRYPFDYNGGIGSVTIDISLKIKSGCSFGKLSYFQKRDANLTDRHEIIERDTSTFDTNSCLHYLSVPTDSCNCDGVDHKQGGVVVNSCYEWRIDPNIRL
jgi:hypothetical protein